MPDFSIKAIHAVIGDWEWSGFAVDEEHDLRDYRTVSLRGTRTWTWREAIEPEWQRAVGVVERLATEAIEGGWVAKHFAEAAFGNAVRGRYRDLPVPSALSLRELPGAPGCAIQLRSIKVEVRDIWQGGSVMVDGSSVLPTMRFKVPGGLDSMPTSMHRAARYAHLLAYRSAAAALADAAVRSGQHVMTAEGALQDADALLGIA